MTATLLDGKQIAEQIRGELTRDVTAFVDRCGIRPALAAILVGDFAPSEVYVRNKEKACQRVGISSQVHRLAKETSEADLLQLIEQLNQDRDVHGILVQLPLPSHLNEERVLQLISIEKDVDGFSPINIGRLAQKGREPLFVPCTPFGCIYLLEQAGVKIEGANAVVLGRSNIVGMPAALLLIGKNATVTVCHSRTRDLPGVVRQADILIAAIGKTEMVRGDWIKPGAAVIDVGINSKPDATKKSGYRLVGDVNFDEAKEVAGFITPVPGGVGPMTIAMLMKNTLRAAEIQQG